MVRLAWKERLFLMPVVPYTIALIAGIVFGYYKVLAPLVACVAFGLCIGISFLLRGRPLWRQLTLVFAMSLIGAVLMNRARIRPTMPEGRECLTVVVADSPKEKEWEQEVAGHVVASGNRQGDIALVCHLRDLGFVPRVGQTLCVSGVVRMKHDTPHLVAYGSNVTISDSDGLKQLPLLVRLRIESRILRERILREFRRENFSPEEYALVAAMGFGDKSGISKETREVFSQTGAAHLLALSGMHLGILFVILLGMSEWAEWLIGRLWFRLFSRAMIIAVIWGYVLLTGMSLSVVRSAVMLTLYTAISFSSRDKMSVNALALAALLILLFNPMAIWNKSFQMSFMAMVGIFVFSKPLYYIIGDRWLFEHPLVSKVWALSCVSISAQLLTLPLQIYYFGTIPLLFLLTNLVAVPLVTLLLYCVFLGLALWAIPCVRSMAVVVIQWLLKTLVGVLSLIKSWDIVCINNISINWIQMMLIYLMIVLLYLLVVRMCRFTRC